MVGFPNGKFLLVDCGSQKKSKEGKVFKYVKKYIDNVVGKNNTIDSVLITHGDTDHTAFLPHLSQTELPECVIYGGKRKALFQDNDVKEWIQGLEKQNKPPKTNVFKFEENYFSMEPDADYGSPTNDGEPQIYTLAANYQGRDLNSNSVVILILYGDQGVILTGDADDDTEAFISRTISPELLKRCTLFMLGHHGSYYSTSLEFLNATSPNFAVVSASGSNKSYGHPDCNIMGMVSAALKSVAINHSVVCSDGKSKPYKKSKTKKPLLVTATNGDIRYVTDGINFKIMASSLDKKIIMD